MLAINIHQHYYVCLFACVSVHYVEWWRLRSAGEGAEKALALESRESAAEAHWHHL